MQVIITMGGSGLRYKNAGFQAPKPLVQIAGETMIEHHLKIYPAGWKIILACSPEVAALVPANISAEVAVVAPTSRGPLDTVLQVLETVHLTKDEPIIVSYCDFSVLWDLKDFEMAVRDYDAGIVSYRGFHPTYFGPNSYCHLQVDPATSMVMDLQEKKFFGKDIFQEWTSCGLYYFKSIVFLQECLLEQIQQKLKHEGGEFYTSLAIKAMMSKESTQVLNFEVKNFYQFGTPEDWERADFWFQYFQPRLDPQMDLFYPFKFIPEGKRPIQGTEQFQKELEYWKPFFL